MRNGRVFSVLLGGTGMVSALLGALLAVRSAFGTGLYDTGLVLHLLGIAGCLFAVRLRLSPLPIGRPHSFGRVGAVHGAVTGAGVTLRHAAFRGSTQALRAALGLVVLVFGAVAPGVTARNLRELLMLRHAGQLTQAQVFNKEPEVQLGNATSGLVYYSYRIGRRTVTGRFRAPRVDYPALYTGRHLAVTYLPADPAVHRLGVIDSGRARQEGAGTLLLLLSSGLYVLGPIIALERALRRELRLARCGVAIEATIIGSKPLYRNGKAVGQDVRYEFVLPGGPTLRGNARVGRAQGEPTLIGFPIAVFYDAARPERHRPLAALRAIRVGGIP